MPVLLRTGTIDRRAKARLLCLLSCIRFDEVLLLQGTPLLGALFAMDTITETKGLELLVLFVASSFLVGHVFVLNDWSGASTDLRDPNRATQVFTTRGTTRAAAGILCLSLLAVSLLLLTPFGSTTLSLALSLAVLSALYSAPWFALKGVPLASSVLHVVGGLLHFLLGYSLFRPLDARSLGIGSFFALTFAAGHLTHEARDCGSDLLNGIQTNAVKFGPTRSFAAGFLLFTAADVLLFMMAIRGVVPGILALVAGVYPLHAWWTARTLALGLTFANIRRLQVQYRVLYAIIGIIMVLAVSLEMGRFHSVR